MSENPIIATEIERLGSSPVYLQVLMTTATRHKVFGFIVDHQIPDSGLPEKRTAEEIAVGIVLARYFQMMESERFRGFFNEKP